MDNFKEIRVKYNHPAIPPMGVKLNCIYIVGYLIDNYKLDDLAIKTMFTPVDCNWDELEKKKDNKNGNKKIKTEEVNKGVEI